jgi:hypothetical protein
VPPIRIVFGSEPRVMSAKGALLAWSRPGSRSATRKQHAHLSDEALVALVARGDEAALGELYNRVPAWRIPAGIFPGEEGLDVVLVEGRRRRGRDRGHDRRAGRWSGNSDASADRRVGTRLNPGLAGFSGRRG